MISSSLSEVKPFVPSIIALSPKKKSKKQVESKVSETKDSKKINYELVEMPERREKPFGKIPDFNKSEIEVKQNIHSLSVSKGKKLTVTKLIFDASKILLEKQKEQSNIK